MQSHLIPNRIRNPHRPVRRFVTAPASPTLVRTAVSVFASVFALAFSCATLAGCTSAEDREAAEWNKPIEIGSAPVVPVVVSGDLAAGEPSQFLFALDDAEGTSLAAPATKVAVDFFDLDRSVSRPVGPSVDAEYVDAVPGVRGMYAAPFTFARPGVWGARMRINSGDVSETARVRFDVKPESVAPSVGERIPDTATPTAADVGGDLAEITSADPPDPALYQLGVPEALAAGRPFVVVFGTPRFCTSGTCTPVLDVLGAVRRAVPDANYLHVEIYEDLASSKPTLSPVVGDWDLRSEPWVFVVNSDGTVHRKFEGAVSEATLRAAVESAR